MRTRGRWSWHTCFTTCGSSRRYAQPPSLHLARVHFTVLHVCACSDARVQGPTNTAPLSCASYFYPVRSYMLISQRLCLSNSFFQYTAQYPTACIAKVASACATGVWITLAERPSPGEQDMHPDASSHLQHYLDNASCDVLMQLTFHEAGSRNNPFSGMSFSHLETIAQALLTCKGKCTRGKHTYSTTLQEATGLLATRLSHRIRFDLKSASPEETAQAANAFACVRLAVWHDPGPKSVQGLCATFKKHLLLTSLAQTTQITAKLVRHM